MKKRVLAALLAGAMVLSLAACGNSGGGSDDGDSGSDSSSMVVSWWGNQTRNDRTTEVINMYLEEHPDLEIDGQFSEWADYWNKLATNAAGNALPDIIQMDYMYVDQYVKSGLLIWSMAQGGLMQPRQSHDFYLFKVKERFHGDPAGLIVRSLAWDMGREIMTWVSPAAGRAQKKGSVTSTLGGSAF